MLYYWTANIFGGERNYMKALSFSVLAAMLALSCMKSANANEIAPGQGNTSSDLLAFPTGTQVATTGFEAYASAPSFYFSGFVDESVFQTSTGTLDFVLQIDNTGETGIGFVSISDFSGDGSDDDVGYVFATGTGPPLVNRLNDAVGFLFSDVRRYPAELVIVTDATSYGTGTITVSCGTYPCTETAPGFAPTPTPEPGSVSLMLSGFMVVGLFVTSKIKRARAQQQQN